MQNNSSLNSNSSSDSSAYQQSIRFYKWYMLIFLWGAFFLNQGDRQLFNNVLPLIGGDLKLSDIQLGWVCTIFTIVYGIFVPIAGFAGDVIQKKLVVFLSLLTFSIGTLMTCYIPGSEYLLQFFPGGPKIWFNGVLVCWVLLILVRSIATGAGEAFYYPAANSLIAQYHAQTRATAMAVHQTANYTGVVFGGTLSAMIAYNYGWRMAFYSFGMLGIGWALVILFLFRNDREDLVHQEVNAGHKGNDSVSLIPCLLAILSRPTFYLLALAFGGMCFVNVGFLTWMPKYLIEHFHIDGKYAGFYATGWHHLLAYISVFAAAILSDVLSKKVKTIRIWMEFIGLFFGAPFIWWMGASENLTLVCVALSGFGLFRGIYDSNLFAAMFDVIEPKYRATATGLMMSFAFIIGSFSPVVLAYAAESMNGYGPGLSSLWIVYTVSGILVLLAILCFYKRDREAAERDL